MTGATAGAVVAGALSGCSGEPSEPGGRDRAHGAEGARERGSAPGSSEVSAAADTALRKRLAASGGALRDRYDAVIAAHPALAGRLAPLRAASAAHATALGGAPAGAGGAPAVVPPDPAAALTELAATERRSSAAHTTALAGAGPELARLLASVAAAGAANAYLLTRPAASAPGGEGR
ncbi:hypothetical protein [Streptomyces tsukubensis]|uniref:hypothetical protein n=1 Tax=Streptomyces tsukubensis TaxID=83656 RepID=UPI0038CDBAC9